MVLYLKQSEDVRTLAFTCVYFALFFFMWRTYTTPFNSIVSLFLWFILCHFSFVGAIATHNCIHCPMFDTRVNPGPYLNKLFQFVLTLCYGHPVSSYVPGHNLSHHKYTQQPKDVMRTTKLQYSWHFLNALMFFPRIGTDMLTNDKIYFRAQEKLGRPIVRQLRYEYCVLYTAAAIFILLDYRRWFFFALLPHIWAQALIISFNMLQHDGCDMSSRYNFARNFTGKWLNFLCYNNGYHTIHHLHPGLHWSQVIVKHNEKIQPFIHPNLDQPYILTYMWRTFIWPGIRVDWKGDKWEVPPYEPDTPWYYEQEETYSSS